MKQTHLKLLLVIVLIFGATAFWFAKQLQPEKASSPLVEPQAQSPQTVGNSSEKPPPPNNSPVGQPSDRQQQTTPADQANVNGSLSPKHPSATTPNHVMVVSDTFERLRASEVLKVQQTSLANGKSSRVDTLVKTDGKYPSVLVRQQFSANTPSADSLASEAAFVSDHVIVAPQSGETEAAFDARIQQAGFRTLKRLPNSDVRLVSVGAPTLTAVDQALQRLAGAEPDYLVFTQETLGSAKELIWVEDARRFFDPEIQDWWTDENSPSTVEPKTVQNITSFNSPAVDEGGMRVLDFEDGNGDYRPYVYRHGFKISRSVPETDPFFSVYIQEAYTTGYPQNGGSYLRTMSSDETAVFEHKDKLPFKAHSVDLAEYSTVFPGPKTINVTGVKQNGSTVTTSFTTDGTIDGTGPQADFQTFIFPTTFDSLVKLTFSNPPFMVDNMRVTLDGQETPPAVPPTFPVIYDVSWNESLHELGKTTAVGGNYAPSSINFGTPTVRSSFGVLTDRPIEMIGGGATSNYSQPRFDLLLHAKRYRLEFEMSSIGSDGLSVFFDGPTNFVSFTFANGFVSAHGATMPPSTTYVPSSLNRVVLEVDVSAKTFSYQLNDKTPVSGNITSTIADVRCIRLSVDDVAPAGGLGIDNVRISAFGIGEQTSAPIATVFPSEADGLTFPLTAIGSSVNRLITIRNHGLSPLSLQFLSLSNPQFSLDGPLPAQLTSGQSFNISTRFIPSTTGTITGDLKIATNDPAKPVLTIPLRGTVQTAPRVSLDPAHLRATVLANTRGKENFLIRNDGTSPLYWQIVRTPSIGSPNHPELQTNDPQLSSLWSLKSSSIGGIDALTAWQVHTGSPDVTVAVIDTGVSLNHPDLKSNLKSNTAEIPSNQIDDDNNGFIDDVDGWNFYFDHSNPDDQHGHGTHVAGTIAAAGNNNIGVVGVTWNCRVLPIQFLGPTGSGYTSDAISSVNYARQRGAQFINASWGGGGFSSLLQQSIQNFCQVTDGLFIAAAGNQGINTDISPHYPSTYALDGIISVASTTSSSLLSSFSNYGKLTVDLAAPGSNILSTLPGGKYGSYSGTSMAAPHVAGVAALLKSANPSYSGQQIKTQILTSTDYPPALNQRVASDGRLNAYQALRKMPESWLRPLVSYGTVAGDSEQTVELEVNSTGLAPGIHQSTLALTTNDPARPNIQLPVELKVVVPTTLASWRSTNFAQNQLLHLDSADSLWADDADPDGDGIDNLLEFAFNLSPHQRDSISESLALISTAEDPAHLLVTTRSNLGPVDIIPEWSSSLQPNSWSSSGLEISPLSTNATEGTTTWKIILDPALGSPSRAFFRVRADSNEN